MDALPDELILEILKYLSLHHVHHLRSICLASHRYHYLASELMYHTYIPDLGDPGRFIRTLAASPGLGDLVRHVAWDFSSGGTVYQPTRTLKPAERHRIECRLAKCYVFCCSRHEAPTLLLKDESFLYSLLLLTPKLGSVHIHAFPTLWSLGLHPPMFKHLHEAIVSGPMRLQHVIWLFLIPSLRVLCLEHIAIDRNRAQFWDDHDILMYCRLHQQGSNVEDLSISHCFTDTIELVDLLPKIRKLKRFSFDHLEGRRDGGEMADYEAILDGIVSQRDSLEYLHLRDWRPVSDISMLGVLKELRQLDHLDLDFTISCYDRSQLVDPGHLILFFQYLPEHIRKLSLQANEDYEEFGDGPSPLMVNTLHAIAPKIRTLFPDLETLAIVNWDSFLGCFPCQTQMHSLQLAFGKNGVNFVSRASVDELADTDSIHMLDYVERDWVWVQAITGGGDGLWISDIGTSEYTNTEYVVFDRDREDDWVEIIRSVKFFGDGGRRGMLHECTVEQPVWLWEEIQGRKL